MLVTKLCLTLATPWTVAHPQGSSVHGISRVVCRISYSRGSSQPRNPTHVSYIGRQILYHWATWEALLAHTGARKLPLPNLGLCFFPFLMIEAWHLLQKEKKVFLPPCFSFDYKTVAVNSQDTTFSCLPACKPRKHPILTNPFLSINFASHWILSELDIKDYSPGALHSPQNTTPGFRYALLWPVEGEKWPDISTKPELYEFL